MVSLKLLPPQDIAAELGVRLRERRLALDLTQVGLAERSGVPVSTLRKFESTGQISLVSFIRLTMTLGDDAALNGLLQEQKRFSSIDEVLEADAKPKRGRRK